ncbi:hypothetical protein L1049_003958 [Liquidambar formosana]|uniref:VTT domain-containing protein n=1 Tax=Liquidambar formosana TaxID=63359 RepID=A0AAP0WZV4_LIQFO
MSLMAVPTLGSSSSRPPTPAPPHSSTRPHLKHLSSFGVRHRVFSHETTHMLPPRFFNKPSLFRMRNFRPEGAENYEAPGSRGTPDGQERVSEEVFENQKNKPTGAGSSFLAKLAIALGIAATVTVISIGLKRPVPGSSLGVQCLADGLSPSVSAAPPVGFTVNAFGYRLVLPEYAPGWIYFWLLMAAGCGLFISEEALNIWVGISLAQLLSLDGTWQSFAESFSRNAPYILSTILWVYWGVCISDMVPFYLGKLFSQTKASDDVCSKLGISKEKALSITQVVQRYGNLVGFVERFSIGVRNPTAFLAGALGISPEFFFAGVCVGGLITLPLQLGIGFLMRERPVFALATVASVVGIWTVFPYAVAASTALVLFLRHRYT